MKDHAIYLSVAEVVHDPNRDFAVVKIKVFTDDMEDALSNLAESRISLKSETDCQSNKLKIEAYFAKHFSFSVDSQLLNLNFTQCELLPDAIWFQFKIRCPEQWSTVEVKADYLMELFPTQSNIVSITYQGEKRFSNFTRSKRQEAFKF